MQEQINDINFLLNELFEYSPDAIVLLSDDGLVVEANPALEDLTAFPVNDLPGIAFTDLLTPESKAVWEHNFAMLAQRKWKILETSFWNSQKNTSIPVVINLLTRTIIDGQPVTLLHCHNTTVYRAIEKALVASQDQWEMSFEAITTAMCILGGDGKVLRANRAFCHYFNISGPKNLLQRHYSEVIITKNQKNIAPLLHPLKEAPYHIAKTAFQEIPGWFEVSSYPLHNTAAEVTGAVLIIQDITERVKAETALRKSQALLRQTDKMEAIGKLTSHISHDFNNLLTSILGYGTILQEKLPSGSPLLSDVQNILTITNQATTLTRQLLSFSHEHSLKTCSLRLNPLIQNFSPFFNQFLSKKVKVELRLTNGLYAIQADSSKLEQILLNLTVNAMDSMPDGGRIVIETKNFSADQLFATQHPPLLPGDYVLLRISDTGQGIPAEVLEHIFEPFFTTKPKGKGTGLGLAIIYSIVQQFNGHITCCSEEGQGTTFSIYFPSTKTEPLNQEKNIVATTPSKQSATILVVDDEIHIVNLIKHVLTKQGYETLTSTSSQEALDMSNQHQQPIDLVLTDLVMPGTSGAELVKQLRSKRPEIKTLFMSGYSENAAAQNAGLPPNAAFLQKPFNFDTLSQKIYNVLHS